ncbi:Gamma tubulin complex component C-terminal [Phytophthora infestans]|uniref:Gamma tubulin complex component C-terminal n=1 Tax=Phytophthora infestans TaxID=4787 RepID=A0A8S9UA73_PHYIN|nr:Gamma tubulin complex component C-terminal [Phytophthora infestans]
MAPVPAWTREWRPLARQLCAHISGNNQNHEEEQSSFSKEALFLRADRVVGQLYSHRFVDTLPQDVHAQAQALATKFRIHSLEERADKLLQLAPQCEYQVLKLLLELATSPTTATDQEVAVDQDTKSRWNTVLQQQQLKIQQEKLMQDQLVEELFQISTNDEWYQAWEDSDEDESDWDMNSADGSAVESERSVNAGHRNAKRPSEALEDEKVTRQQPGRSESSEQTLRQEIERKRMELSVEELQQDEILCRYYPEVSIPDMPVDDADPTCELETRKLMPFTLDRPWLLCEAVVTSAESTVAINNTVPSRLIHEETVVRMIFEALHGVDSLLFEFHPVRPSPSIFSFDFQTKMVKRSRDSFNVAVGHLSPLALQHILDTFTQAATELQTLRDFVGFIRRVRDLSVQHRCVTLEGLAHALSDVIRSLTDSICDVEQQTNTVTGLQKDESTPWSGITPRQPTLLGIYGGLKETFKMISWLKGILMECFSGLSDRHWHEVKRAEQAKCVLDSLYRIMEVEYVEGITADEAARNSGRLARCDVLLHLFTGALSPYLDLINRMVFERGHFETIPLDGELFFASTSAGASPQRESRRNRSFREGLMPLAPFQVNRSLVPTFLESTIPLMDEALASRQLKNRFLQQHTSVESVKRPEELGLSLHQSLMRELETMGCRPNRGVFSLVTRRSEEGCLSSQQVLVECVPFNRILERCLTIHLEEKCRKLNGEITDIFRDKLNYLGHVEALRMFVLMKQQDVFNVFSERLIAHMQENPISWADSEVINSFHQSAVQGVFEDNSLSSSQRQIGGRLSVRVDFNLLDSATSSARIDIATLKCMHFTFAAQQPLRVFFSASIMQKYSRLGVFLVQVKSVESALVKFKSTLRHRRSYSYIEKDMRQVLLQSADMLHYTKSLLSYLTSQVSRKGWSKYRDTLKCSRRLAEMDATHEQYLDYLLNRFFLLDKHATVIQYILTTFNHILRFVRQVDAFVSAVDRDVQKYFPAYADLDQQVGKVPSVRLLEHPDFRVLQSEMARNAKEFKRQSHFLVVMLTAMQKHGASPHVNEIVTQLNYNYFYHQQETRSRPQPQDEQPRPVQQVSQAKAPALNRSGSLRPPPAPKKFSRTRSVQMS